MSLVLDDCLKSRLIGQNAIHSSFRRILTPYHRSGFDIAESRGVLKTDHAIEPPQIKRSPLRVQGFERPDGTQFLNDDRAVFKPIVELFDPLDQGIGRRQFEYGIVRIVDPPGLGVVHGDGSFVKVRFGRELSICVDSCLLLSRAE